MSYEVFMEYYKQVQDILANNAFQDYGVIGLFLNSLLSATAIPLPTEILTSALLIGGENIFLVGIALVDNNEFRNNPKLCHLTSGIEILSFLEMFEFFLSSNCHYDY